ncbi:hypothetical protein BJ875DRAFT_479108 [Amylocarpus encephaloides]|uniref:Uncharacterized protein n=1 Tax=Amylocarpus encephaloides TaxID=45428 RepID=A0A9P7YTZ9_9HELO|nr:hypothetical protein BJ875DRAFT_479108 [Amylocarpus encephaloides]
MKFTIAEPTNGTIEVDVVLSLNKADIKEFRTRILELKHECYVLAAPGDLISLAFYAKLEEDDEEFVDLVIDGILRSTSAVKKGNPIAAKKKQKTVLKSALFYRFEAGKKKGLKYSALEVLPLRQPTKGLAHNESLAITVGTIEVQIWRKYANFPSSESSAPVNVRAPTYEQVHRWVDFGKPLVKEVPQDYEIGISREGTGSHSTLKTRLAENREGFHRYGSACFRLASQASLQKIGFEVVKADGIENKRTPAISTSASVEIVQGATPSAKGKSTVVFSNMPTPKKRKSSKKSVASTSKDGTGPVKKKSQAAPEVADMASASARKSDTVDKAPSAHPIVKTGKRKQAMKVARKEADTTTTTSQHVNETPSASSLEEVNDASTTATDARVQVHEMDNSAGNVAAGAVLDDSSIPTNTLLPEAQGEAVMGQPLEKQLSIDNIVDGSYSQVVDGLLKDRQAIAELSLSSQFPMIGEGIQEADSAQKTQQKKPACFVEGEKGGPANQDRALRNANRLAEQMAKMSPMNLSTGLNARGASSSAAAPAKLSSLSSYEPLTPPASALKSDQAPFAKAISSSIPLSFERQPSPDTPGTNNDRSRSVGPCLSDVEEVEPEAMNSASTIRHQGAQITPAQTKAESSIMMAPPSSFGLGINLESRGNPIPNSPQLVQSTGTYGEIEEGMNNMSRLQRLDSLPATSTGKATNDGPQRGTYGSGRAWKSAPPAPAPSRQRGDRAGQPRRTRRGSPSSPSKSPASCHEAAMASMTDDAVETVSNTPLPPGASLAASPSPTPQLSPPVKSPSPRPPQPSPPVLLPPAAALPTPATPRIRKRKPEAMEEASLEPEHQTPRKVSFARRQQDLIRRLQEAEARVQRLREENEHLIEQEQLVQRLAELEREAEQVVQDNARRQAHLTALGDR